MLKRRAVVVIGLVPGLVPLLATFSCIGDGNGNPDASDASNSDVMQSDGEAGLPIGAKITFSQPTTTWVPQNGQTQVPFNINRNNVNGALTVHAIGLPSGVTAADVTVADGQSNGSLAFASSSASTLGLVTSVNVQLLDQTQVEDQKQLIVGISGPPGSLDTTWGQNGTAAVALTNRTIGYAMDVYPANAGANAGKIVVGGVERNSISDARLIIARFLPTGQFDTTFGDPTGDGGARAGYVLYNPGMGDTTKFATLAAAVRVDSKGRVVMFNNRYDANNAPYCVTELGRWTVDGDVDTAFTRFSGGINPAYCGDGTDARVLPNDDVAVLANWNVKEGMESIVQVFSGADGSRQGNGYHVRLDTTGTSVSQQTNEMYRIAVDKAGGYVMVGRKCAGGWNSSSLTSCSAVIARITNVGALDTTFGDSSGYTGFALGTGTSQGFLGAGIDPTTGDIVAAGRNAPANLAALARVSSSGLPISFGSGGSLTRDLLGGSAAEELDSVSFDSAGRIVSAGNASKTQNFVATTRSSANGTADSTYGTGGVNATTPGVTGEAAIGVDDRLYVAGSSGNRLVVWRFWP